jgi:hypothetical protein
MIFREHLSFLLHSAKATTERIAIKKEKSCAENDTALL